MRRPKPKAAAFTQLRRFMPATASLENDRDSNAFRPMPLTEERRAYRRRLHSTTRARLGFVVAATGQPRRCVRKSGARTHDARLQPVHGLIGPVQQLRGVLAMMGINGLADGGSQLLLLVADPIRQRYALANRIGRTAHRGRIW